ncbi:DUF4920 domain-containing protein [Rhodocytophaga aerolata]|uniref:DUF4920 domain-containing protein n=1 Tax=Rhodocytophaga aerolata TaxID=455078 RepID=A0ABT8QYH2_9BACT|nr:DUF4920 domain-containing protein [Rhodocytophaga aerolata]MDO1444890.1 DUF4920 domain-containing protein [Rhodocytophaga aerolata]
MKKINALFAVLCMLTAFLQNASAQNPASYGAHFVPDNPVPASALTSKLNGKESVDLQTTGTVKEVCQAKGCWIKVDAGNGQEMLVKFKDYAFFVPKDIVGKQVVLNGKAFQKTIPVAQLQHYAEDAGKSKEEIAKITQPQSSLQFEADGVLVKN